MSGLGEREGAVAAATVNERAGRNELGREDVAEEVELCHLLSLSTPPSCGEGEARARCERWRRSQEGKAWV